MHEFCQCGNILSPSARFCPVCGIANATTAAPKRKSRVGLLSIVLIVLLVWFIGTLPDPRTATSRTTSAGGTRVTYLVTGPGTVGLTFKNESGGTEQRTVSLPWSLEFGAGRGAFLYVSAQKQQKDGTIRAEIHLNGSLLQQAESDSAYGIASVNGMVARF